MRAGTLDQRVKIESKVEARDAEGGVTESWATFDTVWAKVIGIGGREFFDAAAVNAEDTVVFRVRWRTGILQTMRMVWDGRNYDIRAIKELGRNDGLEITGVAARS